MTATTENKTPEIYYLSEVFLLSTTQNAVISFQVVPEIDRETGNRLSYHLCRLLKGAVAIWYEGKFWILPSQNGIQPDIARCQEAIHSVQEDLTDLNALPLTIQEFHESTVTPVVLSKLAYQILKIQKPCKPVPVTSIDRLTVNRHAVFWSETCEIKEQTRAALGLTVKTKITFEGSLADFYASNISLGSPEKLLIGLPVQDFEMGGNGYIEKVVGEVGNYRERLLKLATGQSTKSAIQTAPDNELVVAIKFGKGKKLFHYPLSGLRPSITAETAKQFGYEYGDFLRLTKIDYEERQNILINFKNQGSTALKKYYIQIEYSLNSKHNKSLFWQPKVALDRTPLLFGDGVKGVSGRILYGLSKGGVYRRHPKFKNEIIRIAVLNLCDELVKKYVVPAQIRLQKYGFDSEIINREAVDIKNSDRATVRANVEKALSKLITVPVDIVITFLPKSDRKSDDDDGGSYYHLIYSLLLRRNIASQIIYDDTLGKGNYEYILNQVIPGILAKLGNLPFILAEPLQIADYFIGLDISRTSKTKLAGTLNACASVRLYGKQGEFIRYAMEDALLEGEEIPQRLLERLLPTTLEGKTVLIYRDGRFCGREVPCLLERAQAIKAKFILVECRKSGVPRLYKLIKQQLEQPVEPPEKVGQPEILLAAPTKGLALRLSSRDALLVTTQVNSNVGVPQPIRLTIHESSASVTIEQVVDTTLKLTLLHHGSLKPPRLPMPIFGADRVAGLRLKGIYPSGMLEGDRQFWL